MNIWKEYPYKGKLDWKLNPYEDKSWVLYFHSLRMVSFLCNAFEESRDEKYLNYAKELIRDWCEHNPINKLSVKMAWNEHSASNRVLNIIYYIEMVKKTENIDYDFVNSLLISLHIHGEYLADSKNYVGNNHGIMQDKALLELALFYDVFQEAPLWLSKSIQRLSIRLKKDISEEGVHLEHSPYYHLMVLQLFSEIEEMLNSYGKSLGGDSKYIFVKMKEYLAYVIKPDGKFPLIGDTNDSILGEKKILNHPSLKYVLSKGKEGIKPDHVSKVYPLAGIGIFRDEWKQYPEFSQSSYLCFQAGYHSLTHKHGDDLSFVLSSLGQDIFIDSGKYNYDKSNKYRQYCLSACSHNTITVDGRSYNLNRDNINKSRILDWKLSREYDWIKGEHTLYDGIKIIREICLIKPNGVVIIDSIQSETYHSYQQLFNLSPEFMVTHKCNDGISAVSKINNMKIKLIQLSPVEQVEIYYGTEKPLRGYASPTTNQLIKIQQVEFQKKGNDVEFITIIKLKSDDYENKISNIFVKVQESSKVITYNYNDVLKSIRINK